LFVYLFVRKLQSTNYQNLGELVVLCPISYTILQIGGRWKPLIIDRLLKQPMRYSELKRSMPSVTERVMTRQLKELEQDGIIIKNVYKAKPPKVIEYQLSDKGLSLKEVLTELYVWGNENNRSADKSLRKIELEIPL
jgi:DNA-binding HxlR family transcriptional regulator